MRQIIERYAFFWNTKANEGHMHFQFSDGSRGQAFLDSPQEGQLLLDVLRNEQPVYYDDAHDMIMTGLEPVGEGEDPGKNND